MGSDALPASSGATVGRLAGLELVRFCFLDPFGFFSSELGTEAFARSNDPDSSSEVLFGFNICFRLALFLLVVAGVAVIVVDGVADAGVVVVVDGVADAGVAVIVVDGVAVAGVAVIVVDGVAAATFGISVNDVVPSPVFEGSVDVVVDDVTEIIVKVVSWLVVNAAFDSSSTVPALSWWSNSA